MSASLQNQLAALARAQVDARRHGIELFLRQHSSPDGGGPGPLPLRRAQRLLAIRDGRLYAWDGKTAKPV